MAQTPIVMTATTRLTASAVVMYEQGANSVGQVLRATVYNSDTSARLVTVHRVADGDTPTGANTILSGAAGRLLPGQEMVINALAGMVLNAGDSIQALADVTNVVNFTMSGYNS